MAVSPRDQEERRIHGGSITLRSRDAEERRIEGVAISWVGRDAEEIRKGSKGS